MELLNAFVDFRYPNEIGPGVYDIHSPRVPTTEEMVALLRKAGEVLTPDQIWVNPDCGLKTRGWPEVEQYGRSSADCSTGDLAKINLMAAQPTIGRPQRARTPRRSRSAGKISLFQSAPCAS